jgi:hypothetical protein
VIRGPFPLQLTYQLLNFCLNLLVQLVILFTASKIIIIYNPRRSLALDNHQFLNKIGDLIRYLCQTKPSS